MSEFDSIFAATWKGDAPPEALADWIIERLPESPMMVANYLYLNEDRYDPDWSHLLIEQSVLEPEVLMCSLRVRNLQMMDCKNIRRDRFAEEFPKWLNEQVDFVYYVLSK